jgi:hypothetical protein
MKKLVLISALLLTACATTPTGLAKDPVMPDLPPPLNEKAQPLPPLTDNTMGGLQVQGAEDDKQYNKVRRQNNTIIDAWACVKKALAEKKDATACFNDAL